MVLNFNQNIKKRIDCNPDFQMFYHDFEIFFMPSLLLLAHRIENFVQFISIWQVTHMLQNAIVSSTVKQGDFG